MSVMKKKIDLFCYRHPNFGIKNLMRYIVIANVVIWILQFIKPRILNYFVFDPYLILQGQIWRLVSFMFIPVSTGFLALIAFYFYYMIGNVLEVKWGTGRFTIYFFTGVILTLIYGFLLYFITEVRYQVDAQFIYLSMFFSFAALFPDMQVLLFFIIPIKIKWLALVDAAIFVYSFVTTPFPFNLLPVVAVLNFLIFCWDDVRHDVLLIFERIKSFRRRKTYTANTVSFKQESARLRQKQSSSLYTHKCAVCGRTDTDHPELEFRFCSKCAGYHCFCQDHINNHIHFTE
ncbi:MAG: hypothetical protein IJJ22_00205 [Oscillospiraceae bacterium]|nr:hypothetical protein [Oscillospiraceae bacterium]